MDIIKDIAEINRRLSFDLWNMTSSSKEPRGLSSRLVLPTTDDKIRVSEQEARVLYTSILNSSNYFYSIETPTEKLYSQKGSFSRRALSDLSLYAYKGENGLEKVANVEFKALNPDVSQISKDIEKLVGEGIDGNWFHFLKNIDSGTLPSLFNKFIDSLEMINPADITKPISIYFCFCVLDKKWACAKHYFYDPKQGMSLSDYNRDFFHLGYTISVSQVRVDEKNEWNILMI
ncbi:hypothetical protein DFP93_109118 [Aneurinibacillus soli]|uniref:Uncharacterized protein n=1 Tax=Aneurinibacillus soli TaxID=1500254 RepID=A0A0U5AVI6_9BACL|nr:hypothetical protein [Aneurinibacillus soli]PYE61417.1 hypothetical protein DFP93_109118 [Aneurinibacillus soli]BAU27754.1 hypothetical protein CB4_01928 [Aneurinibacillus soli]